LGLRFGSLVLPFADLVLVNPAQGEQFLLVIDQLIAAGAGERVILH
jgi:hypothetical protein